MHTLSHGLLTDLPITSHELSIWKNGTVHIIGAASAEGVAVARFLLRQGFADLTLHDMRERDQIRRAFRTNHGAYSRVEQDQLWNEISPLVDSGQYGDDYLKGLGDTPDVLVVLGQGWYLDENNRRSLVSAIPQSARITSMTALYLAFAPGPVVAVTGTNGKSTTVELIGAMLQQGGVPFRAAGNERSHRQFLPEITDLPVGTVSLLEISNRQLLQIGTSPNVCAITELTPDHLEEHGGWDGYVQTKRRLFAHQSEADVAIVNDDSGACRGVVDGAGAGTPVVRCGVGEHRSAVGPAVYWSNDKLFSLNVPRIDGEDSWSGLRVLAERSDVRIPGTHNLRNAAVAAAVALVSGVDPSVIDGALRSFSGMSLRLEKIADVNGVAVWSDLKASTAEATLAALEAIVEEVPKSACIHLILGGEDKGLDYTALAARMASLQAVERLRPILLPGSASEVLARCMRAAGGSSTRCLSLDEALDLAFGDSISGDVVIVSPAAAGFWSSQLQGGPSLRQRIKRRQIAL